jgi:Carboxypeptidase regulatory-like domain
VSRRILFAANVFLFCGIVWGAQQATTNRTVTPAQQTAPNSSSQQTRAKISGVVNSAGAGQPVRKALVTLMSGTAGQGNNRGQGGFAGQLNQPGQAGQINPQQGTPQAQPGQAGRGQQQSQNAQNGQRGGGAGGARSVTTSDDGVFTFEDVTPGTYRIRVDRDGFLSQEYGQRSWTGAGVPLTIQAGQTLSSVTFQLVQGGTIAGRILDENLEPVVGIQVQSLTYVYQSGARTLVSERQVQTNDLGEYRLYWLTPGDHYVSAIPGSRRGGLVQAAQGFFQRGGRGGGQVPPIPNAGDTPEDTYAPTFYPGSIDPETAAPVRVAAAAEIRGIDFVLRPTPTAKISGRVVGVEIPPTAQQAQQQARQQQQARRGGNNAGNNGGNNTGTDGGNRGGGRGGRGGDGPFGGNMQVLLTRIGASVGGGRGGGRGGGGRGGRGGGGLDGIEFLTPVNPDGTFLINDVIPGSYNLIAVQQAQNQIYSARTRLDVGRGDITGVNLAVRPGVDVPGQIYIEGTPPANFQINRVRVNLTSLDDLPFIGNSNAQVDETGKFTLTNVPAMSYRINVQGLPGGAYLIAGKFGNLDALGEPLQVDQSSTLALQVGFSPGQIAANVTDSVGQPFSGAITVLIPSVRNRVDLYKTATSDQSGQVIFTGVAPGDYKVIAWEDVPQGAYLNSDFVAPYEDRAQSVHVDRTSSASVQTKVIPRNEQ